MESLSNHKYLTEPGEKKDLRVKKIIVRKITA